MAPGPFRHFAAACSRAAWHNPSSIPLGSSTIDGCRASYLRGHGGVFALAARRAEVPFAGCPLQPPSGRLALSQLGQSAAISLPPRKSGGVSLSSSHKSISPTRATVVHGAGEGCAAT
jgi:hypothetical protein